MAIEYLGPLEGSTQLAQDGGVEYLGPLDNGVSTAPGKPVAEMPITAVGKVAEGVYQGFKSLPTTAINTLSAFTTWPAPVVGGIAAYLGELSRSGDPGTAKAMKDVVQQEIGKYLRVPNSETGEVQEAALTAPLGWPKLLSEKIMSLFPSLNKPLPGKTGLIVDQLSNEVKDLLSPMIMMGATGAAVRGVKEFSGKETPAQAKKFRENRAAERLEDQAPVAQDPLGLLTPKEVGGEKATPPFREGGLPTPTEGEYQPVERGRGVPLTSEQKIAPSDIPGIKSGLGDYDVERGQGIPESPKGTPPFREEPLGVGDTGGDRVPTRPPESTVPEESIPQMRTSPMADTPHKTVYPAEPYIPERTPVREQTTPTIRENARMRYLMGDEVKGSDTHPIKTQPTPPEPPPPTGEGGGASRGEIPPAPMEGGGVPPATPTPSFDYAVWKADEPLSPTEIAKRRQETMDDILNQGIMSKREGEAGIPPKTPTTPTGTLAVMLDDGTKLMKQGAEAPEEVAIANGYGPSRITKVGVVTDKGKWVFDGGKYSAKTGWSILGEEAGATNLTTKAADHIIEMAKRSGKSIKEVMEYLKFDPKDIVAVLQVAREQSSKERGRAIDPFSDEAVSEALREAKAYKKTGVEKVDVPGIAATEVVKEAGPRLEVAANTAREGLTRDNLVGKTDAAKMANALRKAQRIVDPYKEGSGVLPEQARPLIPEGRYTEPSKDMAKWRQSLSPSKWMGRMFDLMNMPVIDGFESLMTWSSNTKQMRRWARDVLKDTPDSSKEVAKVMQEKLAPFRDTLTRYNRLNDELEFAKKAHKEAARGSMPHGQAAEDVVRLQDELEGMAPDMKKLYSSHMDTLAGLAKAYPDVRVYLDASGELPKGIAVSSAEHTAALKLREYLDRSSKRMFDLGIPVRGVGSYMPRVWAQALGDKGSTIASTFVKVPDLLKFMEREDNTLPWFPSAHGAMKAYIPTAEFKMAFQPFLNRLNPFIKTTQNANLKHALERWRDENVYRKMPSNAEKILNGVVGYEYVRYLGFNLGPTFKHALKPMATLSEYGPVAFGKGVGLAAKVPAQLAAEKMGLKGTHAELDLARVYIDLQQMLRVNDEMPMMSKMQNRVRALMGSTITTIEMMDNGVSVMAGLAAGMKKGIDPAVIHRQIWDTIFKANFRGGLDQPLWQKNALVRGLSMFQMTPWKLAEYKMQVIEDMFAGKRDAFGTLAATKVMRMFIAIGVAEAIAQANDTSVIDITLGHLPFITGLVEGSKEGFPLEVGDIHFGQSPVAEGLHRLHQATLNDPGEMKKFIAPEFKAPVVTKVGKIMSGDIPERYGSATKYMINLPKLGESYRSKKREMADILKRLQ